MSEARGQCLCGAVKVNVASISHAVGACHCNMCRKWGGGPYLAVDCGTDVSFEGEDHIGVYESSEWAERGFCKTCGTHLFYRLTQEKHYFMPAGLLDNETSLTFTEEVFVDERPDYYAFANKTHEMTGAELFAKFGSPPE